MFVLRRSRAPSVTVPLSVCVRLGARALPPPPPFFLLGLGNPETANVAILLTETLSRDPLLTLSRDPLLLLSGVGDPLHGARAEFEWRL